MAPGTPVPERADPLPRRAREWKQNTAPVGKKWGAYFGEKWDYRWLKAATKGDRPHRPWRHTVAEKDNVTRISPTQYFMVFSGTRESGR